MNPQNYQDGGFGMPMSATDGGAGMPQKPSQALNPMAPPPFAAAQPVVDATLNQIVSPGIMPATNGMAMGQAPTFGMATQGLPVPAGEPPMVMQSPVLQPPVPVQPAENTVHDGGASQPSEQRPPESQPTDALSPSEAGDTDVIEKEWVIKAKEVIELTRHDPYKQALEINKLRADYMKKRYNRDIKVAKS